MTDINLVIKEAIEEGFSTVSELDISTIRLLPEVRGMCEENKCKAYGNSWSCPPACGTLNECSEQIAQYKSGIIVQTVGQLEDSFDFESMQETGDKHSKMFLSYAKKLSRKFPGTLALGAGSCRLCPECTYPDEPCRYPDSKISSMEAYGMFVSDVCTANGVPYYHGPNTVVYVGCYLLDCEES